MIWRLESDRSCGATPAGKRNSAFPLGIDSLLVPPRLIWLQQIDQWRDARPILERLGQMRWLDRRLICQLGDALRDRDMRATCAVISWSCRIAAVSRRWHAVSRASVGRIRPAILDGSPGALGNVPAWQTAV